MSVRKRKYQNLLIPEERGGKNCQMSIIILWRLEGRILYEVLHNRTIQFRMELDETLN